MRIDLTTEQKERMLQFHGWEEKFSMYYKELEVFELSVPMDKMFVQINPICDVDIDYGVSLDYVDGKLILRLPSQKFTSTEDINVFSQVVNCLTSDFNTMEIYLGLDKEED